MRNEGLLCGNRVSARVSCLLQSEARHAHTQPLSSPLRSNLTPTNAVLELVCNAVRACTLRQRAEGAELPEVRLQVSGSSFAIRDEGEDPCSSPVSDRRASAAAVGRRSCSERRSPLAQESG